MPDGINRIKQDCLRPKQVLRRYGDSNAKTQGRKGAKVGRWQVWRTGAADPMVRVRQAVRPVGRGRRTRRRHRQ